jgi:hypothetical protein
MSIITTASGVDFDLLEPERNHVYIEDVAIALSRCVRFSGQYRFNLDGIYNVAQHSVMVARMCDAAERYDAAAWALMHDATEAFYGDVVTPLKALLPTYVKLENRCAIHIQRRFRITMSTDIEAAVTRFDRLALKCEAVELVGENSSVTRSFGTPSHEDLELWNSALRGEEFRIWSPRESYNAFLSTYRELF